jgi:hypothetical protein
MSTAGFAQAPFFSFGLKSAVNFSRFSTGVFIISLGWKIL